MYVCTYVHTHTRLTALCPGLPGRAGTRKVKPVWILLKQETVSGSGISWAVCKSAPRLRQITSTPPLRFLQAGCPSCCPTKSVEAPKAIYVCMCRTFMFAQTLQPRLSRGVAVGMYHCALQNMTVVLLVAR